MDAVEAKKIVAGYYLWRRNYSYVATEYNFADIFAIDENMLSVEVEIKVNQGDLQGELRTIQHIIGTKTVDREKLKNLNKYMKHWGLLKIDYNHNNIKPNRFYFGVTKELVEKAVNGLKDSPYGLIEIGSGFWECRVVKRGKKLHDEKIQSSKINSLFRKLSTENQFLREKVIQ